MSNSTVAAVIAIVNSVAGIRKPGQRYIRVFPTRRTEHMYNTQFSVSGRIDDFLQLISSLQGAFTLSN